MPGNENFRLHYEDRGHGLPLILLHGVWMSNRFFSNQIEQLSKHLRIIAVDFRSHGRSPSPDDGHTVRTYAQDLRTLIGALALENFVLAGWSMGAMVMWEYWQQFGSNGLLGSIVIDQSASDYAWTDWPLGLVDFEGLQRVMKRLQTSRFELCRDLGAAMFSAPVSDSDLDWMVREMSRPAASVAAAIFFDQTVQDYRKALPTFATPTLLCFGRDGKTTPLEAGEHLREILPNSRLVVFEESGHCPFLEEPGKFNDSVLEFVRALH
jgi:pimeloyl-ACP methyl ester carboxylesterase